ELVLVLPVEDDAREVREVLPALNLRRPHAMGHAQRGDDEHRVHHPLLAEYVVGSEGDGGLPQAWVKEQSGPRVLEKMGDGALLILVRNERHAGFLRAPALHPNRQGLRNHGTVASRGLVSVWGWSGPQVS